MRSGSLFDAFNARFLEPERVGKAFIFTSQFEDVARHQNTMIIGPRGSGKTTYLKMLTLPALRHWKDLRNHSFAKQINYHTIYIPSDFSWYPEFRLPIDSSLSAEVDNLLTAALFRSHVLLAMCDSIQQMSRSKTGNTNFLTHLDIHTEEKHWNSIIDRLSFSWDLKLSFGGVSGLRLAVEKNIQLIQSIMVSCALNEQSASSLMEKWPMLSHFFYDDLRAFADTLTDVLNRSMVFCVCFDEVEIAPTPVRNQIIQSARSFDQRFLVKISSSPFDETDPGQATSAGSMIGHDFHQVMLTQMKNAEVMRFSRRLFTALCQEIGVNNASPEMVLGDSVFNSDTGTSSSRRNEKGNEYAPSGRHIQRFRSLAAKDPSFNDYIERNNIDLNAIDRMSEPQRAALVRKVIAPVIVRDTFLSEGGNESGRNAKARSRKAIPEIYTGARSIFTLCEGNPRWLIGLLRPLIEHYRDNKTTVPPSIQGQHIERALQQYLSLLSTIRAKPIGGNADSAIKLIEQIGEFFRRELLFSEFSPEPLGSFNIDLMVTEATEELVGRALNQGAFVLIPRKNTIFRRGNIRGQRLRITHLLGPFFHLPLVTGRAVDLTKIIAEPIGRAHQIDLFSFMETNDVK